MSNAFDTLKLADRLESAGFTPQQARGAASALSETMTADLATKADLTAGLAELRADLKAEIAKQGSDFRAEINKQGSDFKAEINKQGSDLRAEIAVVRSDTLVLKWMVGFLLALVVGIAVKLFLH